MTCVQARAALSGLRCRGPETLTETLTAKMRILLAPRLLALGGIAALLGVASWLVQLT